jgi:UDPglucose 6-dehydrogenase
VPLRILEATAEVNIAQKARMIKKIKHALGKNKANKTVLILGLTFKANTDDMRESPSLTIIPALMEIGVKILAHDPKGIPEARKLLPNEVKYITDIYKGAREADAVVILTEWDEYKTLDLERLKRNLKGKDFIDLRNLYDPKTLQSLGFDYVSIGR